MTTISRDTSPLSDSSTRHLPNVGREETDTGAGATAPVCVSTGTDLKEIVRLVGVRVACISKEIHKKFYQDLN